MESRTLSIFDLEFRHVRGADKEVADVLLSRIEINSLQYPSGMDYVELAAEQKCEGIRSHGIPSEEKCSKIYTDLHIRASKPEFGL